MVTLAKGLILLALLPFFALGVALALLSLGIRKLVGYGSYGAR